MFITVECATPSGWQIIREHFAMPVEMLPEVFESIRRDLQNEDAELRVWFERINPNDERNSR